MHLSNHIYQRNGQLFNLTTKVSLPVNSNEETLKKHHFLQGQEQQAIEYALFGPKKPEYLSMKLTPTWRCNLRCKHCFVLEKLSTQQKSILDVNKVIQFVKNYHAFFPSIKSIFCCLVGGEITLETQKCLELTEELIKYGKDNSLKVALSLTTNGIKLDLDILELMNRCQTISISIDGTQEAHNWQRKAATKDLVGTDLYEKTLDNIRRLVKLGLREKICVQGALTDQYCKPELVREFFHKMIRAGVLAHNIKVGAVSPTQSQPDVSEHFQNYISNQISASPCCKWRVGNEFFIDETNTISCDYFDETTSTTLGKLDDPIEHILYNHEKVVRNQMPALNDPTCLKCPVIGACWGRCCNLAKIHRPSEVCNQQKLIETVKQEIENYSFSKTKGVCGGNS